MKGSIALATLTLGCILGIELAAWSREAIQPQPQQPQNRQQPPSAPLPTQQDQLYQIQPPTWFNPGVSPQHGSMIPVNYVSRRTDQTGIAQQSLAALQLFEQNRQLEALLLAMKSGQDLQSIVGNRSLQDYPTYAPLVALQHILDRIHERNQVVSSTSVKTVLSPTGDRIVLIPAGENKIQLWNQRGQLLVELPQVSPEINEIQVEFSPDGQYWLTTERQNSQTVNGLMVAEIRTRIWNRDGQTVGQLPTLNNSQSVKTGFSPNGQQVFQISADRQVVTIWTVNGQKVTELSHPQYQVEQVKFSPDAQTIAVITTLADGMPLRYAQQRVWLWNTAGNQLATLDGRRGIDFHPDHQTLLSVRSNQNGTTTLERLNFSGAVLSTQTLPTDDAYPRADLRVSANGKSIVMGTLYAEASTSWKWEAWSIAGEKIMDLTMGREPRTGFLNETPFSPNGKWLVGEHRTEAGMVEVQLYDTEPPDSAGSAPNRIYKLPGQYRSPQVHFTPDSRQLVIVDTETGQVQHWDIARVVWADIGAGTYVGSHAVDQLMEFTVAPTSVTGTSLGSVITNQSDSSKIHLWDVLTRQVVKFTLQLPGDVAKYYQVNSLQFSPDHQRLMVSGESDRQIFSVQGDKLAGGIGGYVNLFSADGRFSLVKSEGDAKLKLIDLMTGRVIQAIEADYGLFSPNGQRWVSVTTQPGANSTSSQQIQIWDLNGTRIGELSGPYSDRADLVYFAFSDDNQTIAVSGINYGTVNVWRNGQVNRIEWSEFASDVRLSANGQRLIIHDQNSVRPPALYSASGQMIRQFPNRAMAEFSPDGKGVLVRNAGQSVFDSNGQQIQGDSIDLWNAETGEKITELSPRSRAVRYNKTGQKMITFSQWGENGTENDSVMQLWDQSGKKIAEMRIDPTVSSESPANFEVNTVLNDDWIIVTNIKTSMISLWDWSGKKMAEFPSGITHFNGLPQKMAVSPDRQLIALGGDDGNVRIFAPNGQLVKRIPTAPNGNPVTAVTFSPDGQSIATGSVNGITSNWIVNWWTLQGEAIGQWVGEQGQSVRTLQFSRDGQKLAVADDRNQIQIWQTHPLAGLLERGCEWLQPYLASHPEAKLEVCRKR